MSELSQRLASLSPEQIALLLYRLKTNRNNASSQRSIPQRMDRMSYPISFAQQRVWFLDQLNVGSAQYNMPAALRLRGELNKLALRQSLNEIIERHDALRAYFTTENGLPVQHIHPTIDLELPCTDLSHLSEDEGKERAIQLAEEEAGLPFDLTTGPLIRAQLVKLSSQDHILLLTIHHIVFDGWSTGIVISELKELYEAYINNKHGVLPPIKIQYADFAAWQNEQKKSLVEKHLPYWQSKFENHPAVLDLPLDRSRPASISHSGAHLPFEIAAETTQQLKKFSLRHGVTLFVTALTAYKVLLYRYTGQAELCVGISRANRRQKEIQNLVGFFVNALPIRLDVEPGMRFVDALKAVNRMVIETHEHQELPFEMLVDALDIKRSTSYSPLFQVMFDLQKSPFEGAKLGSVDMSLIEIESGSAKFDLSLIMVEESDHKIKGYWEYNTDLFDSSTIERLAQNFKVLIDSVLIEAENELDRMPVLTAKERAKMMQSWNRTEYEYADCGTLSHRFEAAVAQFPNKTALRFREERLTYAALNTRANRVAQKLIDAGINPGDLVGLCVERSLEMVIGLLGILKAGAGYVAVDPAYPPDRVRYMLDNSNISTVLIGDDDTIKTLIGSLSGITPRSIKTLHGNCTKSPNLTLDISLDGPAYVIFTSGSTGLPKGVAISHRSIGNHMDWMTRLFRFNAETRVLQKTPFSFDASVWEFYAPLLNGGELIMAEPGGHRDADYLIDTIVETCINTLQLVPTQLRMLLESGHFDRCTALQNLFCGGEALPVDLVEACHRSLSEVDLYNLYGPAEATIDTTYWHCQRGAYERAIPIGRPIDNVKLYILNPAMQPVPIGVPGELYIGGQGVGIGYLNRPELTAKSFVANPFANGEKGKGGKLYKTGDLVRYRPDGAVEFLGRIDRQVKIRGYRIELGEIAAELSRHPAVKEALITANPIGRTGQPTLIAYFTNENGMVPTQAELTTFLKAALPDYMLPSGYLHLDRFPLNPSGKIDHKRLPQPELTDLIDGDRSYEPPRNETEQAIADIWAELLELEQVGIHDDFFALGGHSLLATRVVSQIRTQLQIDLAIRALFENSSVAKLSDHITASASTAEVIEMLPIKANELIPGEPLPLSYSQQRLWFLDQMEPGSSLYNLPAAIHLQGKLNIEALDQTLKTIVERHEILRTTFPAVNGVPTMQIASGETTTLERIDLSKLSEADKIREIEAARLFEASQPFDLAQGPLLRLKLLKASPESHFLLVTMHHIISDGWSGRVILQEITKLYAAREQLEATSLPPLPIQYRDFAAWQRSDAVTERLNTELTFWKEALQDIPPLLELPTDFSRPAVQTFEGDHVDFTLSPELSSALDRLSQSHGASLFMTLLAGFQLLMARYSGQEKLAIGTPIANRNRAEIEGLIGFFVNTLVIPADLTQNPQFDTFLAGLKETVLDAFAHQDVPFEMLVDALKPERDLSHSPLFQVMFVLNNGTAANRFRLGNLQAEQLPPLVEGAKFDLTLFMEERQEGEQSVLNGSLEYNIALFKRETVERMVGHFINLLEAVTAQPDRPVGHIDFLSAAEKEQLLVEWNQTTAPYPAEARAHDLFEALVEQHPDRIAVRYGDETLTFAELNRRANRLAGYLQQAGVGPDTIVALCVDRTLDVAIGIMGVLKAGGAYLPIDPVYPEERISFMLADSRAKLLLTQSHLLEQIVLDPQQSLPTFCFDTDGEALNAFETTNRTTATRPDNLAYVIYTSGSTGRPKGAMIHHQGLVNYLTWCLQAYPLGSEGTGQGAPVGSSISFDLTVTSLIAPLVAGQTVHLLPDDHGVELLSNALTAEPDYSLVKITPAHLELLGRQLEADKAPRSTRSFIIGGEILVNDNLTFWQEHAPETILVNEYGPTETVVGCCVYQFGPGETFEGPAPIGRPIINTELYVLDPYLQPVPVGVVGQLYIGGAGVARGYLDRPDLTADRFIPHPFSSTPGARLYKTGDLARYRPDGNLECLGRTDHQVKIRGFRIELGEIEAVLSTHPATGEVVVVAKPVQPGSKELRLVAYYEVERDEDEHEARRP